MRVDHSKVLIWLPRCPAVVNMYWGPLPRRTHDIKHIKIINNGECYALLTGESYATVGELIEHHMTNPGLV
jgi:hypothetical protein